MFNEKGDIEKKDFDIRSRCISGGIYECLLEDGIFHDDKKLANTIWKLRKMKVVEILVKIVAFSWAIIWSAASILCLFTVEYKLLAPITALPAVGLWIILSKSAGSIGIINQEIRNLKSVAVAVDNKNRADRKMP